MVYASVLDIVEMVGVIGCVVVVDAALESDVAGSTLAQVSSATCVRTIAYVGEPQCRASLRMSAV